MRRLKKKFIWALLLGLIIFMALQLDLGHGPSGCAFCKQEILETNRFYEGEEVQGLLTYKPITSGHVLIVPKRHVERFEDLTAAEMVEIQALIQKIDAYHQHKDYLILQKNGWHAGQTVPHVHFHYIPSEKFLALKTVTRHFFKPLSQDELKLLRERFAESLSR
jgi:histidine triad (HIT) family protein